jgi:hypothetical protein
MYPGRCPGCQSKLDDATCSDGSGATPQPGDLTVCAYCAMCLTFTEDLGVRVLGVQEVEALEPDERQALERAQVLVRAALRMARQS